MLTEPPETRRMLLLLDTEHIERGSVTRANDTLHVPGGRREARKAMFASRHHDGVPLHGVL